MKFISYATNALFVTMSIAGLAATTFAYDRASDSTALWAIKTANPSSYLSTWVQTNTINTWRGVTLTSDRVSTLDLSKKNLSTISPDIKNLTALLQLDLSANHLVNIPVEIGTITTLQVLTLNQNQITSIPKEIGNLSELQTLNLWLCKLNAIPKEIGKLTNLTRLDISSNELLEIPDEFKNLSNLNILRFDGNELSRIPNFLTDSKTFPSLTTFNISQNYLSFSDTLAIHSAYPFATSTPQYPKIITSIQGITAEDKDYDQTTLIAISGSLTNAPLDIGFICSGNTQNENVEKNLTVTTNANLCYLTGLRAGIYILELPTGLKATITPAPLTITATAETITEGETPIFAYSITTGELFGTDKLTGALSSDKTTVGNNDILQGTLTAGNNYDLTYVPAKLTVKAKTSSLRHIQSMPIIDLGRLKRYDFKGRTK